MSTNKRVDITLYFDLNKGDHRDLFFDFVALLHDKLPVAREVVHDPDALLVGKTTGGEGV